MSGMRAVLFGFATCAVVLGSTGCADLFSILAGPGNNLGNNNNNGINNGNNNGGNNNGGSTPFSCTVTNIPVHAQARIAAGDDLVVYGTGGFSGVDYVVPSAGDTSGRGIPDSGAYVSYAFAVSDKNIWLVDSSFQVTVFNAANASSTTIDVGSIRLARIPVGARSAGHIQADGNYCATICDSTQTTDGNILKVIDNSSGAPNVISFTQNPSTNSAAWTQLAVNAATQRVVAVVSDKFYVYDMANPDALPLLIEPGNNGIGATQIAFDGTYVLFHDNAGTPNAAAVHVGTGQVTTFANNPSTGELAAGGGSFAYFQNASADDQIGSHTRTAIGQFPGTSSTLAALNDFIDGATTNNGAFGFGQTLAVAPDGSTWFTAGSGAAGSGEYVQVSTGGAFSTLTDGSGQDTLGCPGSDVSVSGNTLAFKGGTSTSPTVGYVLLSNLSNTASRTNP